jgi:hypothetical protein
MGNRPPEKRLYKLELLVQNYIDFPGRRLYPEKYNAKQSEMRYTEDGAFPQRLFAHTR